MPRRRAFLALLLSLFPTLVAISALAQPDVGPRLQLIASGFDRPVQVTHAGDGSGRLFVTERPGTVRIVRGGQVESEPFLDIRERVSLGGERGLLSIAFPPDYARQGHLFAYYAGLDGDIVISRFEVSADADRADAGSEEVILRIPHPNFDNHYGGQLAFGPDGYLHAGTGDGGGAGDPQGNAQNPDSLLGKLLRIDVLSEPDSGLAYAIPADNPFADGQAGRPEVWALGLRNPWRFSFDRLTGDLWIGDVGQSRFEEIDRQPAEASGGRNYGWNILEGGACYPAPPCEQPARYAPPLAAYGRELGGSVTGGLVYRGPGAGVRGWYVFGDFVSGRIFILLGQGGDWALDTLAETGLSITGFGEDQAGRIHLVDYEAGALHRLSLAAPITAPATATLLMLPH